MRTIRTAAAFSSGLYLRVVGFPGDCSFGMTPSSFPRSGASRISRAIQIAFAETLMLEGIAASIGSVGDAYDNALAETTIGLFKTEAVGRGSPFFTGPLRIIDDVEYATMEWVDWFNNRRLHSVLDYVPPEEYEAAYYAQTRASQPATPQP